MGSLYCSKCDHTFHFDTLEHAIQYADHAVGLTKHRPCPNDIRFMTWEGIPLVQDTSNFPKIIPVPTVHMVLGEHGEHGEGKVPKVTKQSKKH